MKQKINTLNVCLSALFTAIIAVFSQIAVPFPSQVPLTLQTFAIALCGYVLGVKWGLTSIAAYIFLGAVGVPVFAGFKGGIQTLFGVTGGFIYGFVFLTFLCGISLLFKRKLTKVTFGILGLIICHLLGVIQFSVVYKTNFIAAFLMVSGPYLLKDVISVIGALFLSVYLKKIINKILLF